MFWSAFLLRTDGRASTTQAGGEAAPFDLPATTTEAARLVTTFGALPDDCNGACFTSVSLRCHTRVAPSPSCPRA
ncbi:hypothetical protein FOA52_013492 [Chlamydomonas sp. UWO 241]|nr:hypothetical protein FOA52_013492 [Chlamydomonas sp. UWO 241]